MRLAGSFSILGPAGPLEGLTRLPAAAPRLAAVICHPHPLHGGTMHNKVAYTLASALAAAGAIAVRFNFRGVGRSAGKHDRGIGEQADVAAVLDHLADTYPGLPLLVAGYSFGAWVGLHAGARDPRVEALIGVGLATTFHDFREILGSTKPKLIIQGAADAIGPIADVEELVATMAPPVELVTLPGADHFLADARGALAAAVTRFASALLADALER